VYQSGTFWQLTRNASPAGARGRFAHADRGNRRQREGDARHAAVIRAVPITFEKISCHHLPVMARYRRQRRSLGGCVTGRIDGRIGNALQKFVESEAPIFDRNPGG